MSLTLGTSPETTSTERAPDPGPTSRSSVTAPFCTALIAFGIELLDLPGTWPRTTGPTRRSVRWRIDARPFVPSPRWWVREVNDGLIVHFEDEGEYRLLLGQSPEVFVTLGPSTEVEAALAFLLSVVPLALPLFDLEPFHGTALEAPQRSAVLVLGHAETGKSTTATALRGAGLRFLADDACALDERGQLWPGPPLLSIQQLGESDEEFAVYDGKSIVAVGGHDVSPRNVGAVCILRPGRDEPLGIRPLTRRLAVEAVLGEVRAPRVMPAHRERLQFEAAVALAGGPVGFVGFDKARHAPADVAGAIIEWIEAG